MNWLIMAAAIVVIIIAVEAVFILPDKMPWNKYRREKK